MSSMPRKLVVRRLQWPLITLMLLFSGCRNSTPTEQRATVTGGAGGVAPLGSDVDLLSGLINQQRNARGVPSLQVDSSIQSVAAGYALDQARIDTSTYNFAVGGQDGSTRLRNAGVQFTVVGHIGAMNFATAQTVVNALIANNTFLLTSGEYTRIGIGVSNSATRNYWTILVTN